MSESLGWRTVGEVVASGSVSTPKAYLLLKLFEANLVPLPIMTQRFFPGPTSGLTQADLILLAWESGRLHDFHHGNMETHVGEKVIGVLRSLIHDGIVTRVVDTVDGLPVSRPRRYGLEGCGPAVCFHCGKTSHLSRACREDVMGPGFVPGGRPEDAPEGDILSALGKRVADRWPDLEKQVAIVDKKWSSVSPAERTVRPSPRKRVRVHGPAETDAAPVVMTNGDGGLTLRLGGRMLESGVTLEVISGAEDEMRGVGIHLPTSPGRRSVERLASNSKDKTLVEASVAYFRDIDVWPTSREAVFSAPRSCSDRRVRNACIVRRSTCVVLLIENLTLNKVRYAKMMNAKVTTVTINALSMVGTDDGMACVIAVCQAQRKPTFVFQWSSQTWFQVNWDTWAVTRSPPPASGTKSAFVEMTLNTDTGVKTFPESLTAPLIRAAAA